VSPMKPTREQLDPAAHEHLTIAEVCAELKVSRSTFYYWRQTGRGPRCLVLPNREVRVTRSDLRAWLETCAEAADGAA
jgi:excisionase family DNA binding protein